MSRIPKKLYAEIVRTVNAIENCRKSGNTNWFDRHETTLAALLGFLPHGSGIDNGCELVSAKPDKLVIAFSFHHMNENGYYTHWSDYKLTLRPCLQFGTSSTISGRDVNGIKDYLHDEFHACLTSNVWADESGKWHCGLYETFTK